MPNTTLIDNRAATPGPTAGLMLENFSFELPHTTAFGALPRIVGDTNRIRKEAFFWIRTNKFRFDYRIENGKVIEFDKVGDQGIYRKAVNEAA